jgi:hypothetical protein
MVDTTTIRAGLIVMHPDHGGFHVFPWLDLEEACRRRAPDVVVVVAIFLPTMENFTINLPG